MTLTVKLRPAAAEFVYKSLDASALPGTENKRLAVEVQEALVSAAQEAHEAEQAQEDAEPESA